MLASLTMTLIVYWLAHLLYQRSGRHPLCNPVPVAAAALIALLTISGFPYERYFEGAQVLHFLLGPAIVALAVPLYRNLEKVLNAPLTVLAGIGGGSISAALSAVLVARWLEAGPQTVASILPKSVTTPVAMGISQAAGGLPPLTAVFAILTGMLGASIGPLLLNLMRVTDPKVRGLAMGTASHGIGTARALQEHETAGAFSGLAMGLAALSMSFLLPLLWRFALA